MTRAGIAVKRKVPKSRKPRIVAASAKKAPMKVCHWSLQNGSGMANVAQSMVQAEKKLDIDSIFLNIETDANWDQALDADVHVSHTHIPVMYRGKAFQKQVTKPFKMVGCWHGTPEHIFEGSVHAGENGAYAPSNSLMISQHDLKRSHARVTFWPRHKAIYDTMMFEGTKMHLVPLGVERDFWNGGASRGKYQGEPSVWSGENCHEIKWPLDLLLMWPWVSDAVDDAYLHLCYLPHDQARFWFPLAHANGAYYRAHMGAWTYPHSELRNIFKSVDFVLNMVRYGDFNRIGLEAGASGAKVISYAGNRFSDYWLPEGDQRIVADALIKILRGETEPRKDKLPVPDVSETASAMRAIYESIL